MLTLAASKDTTRVVNAYVCVFERFSHRESRHLAVVCFGKDFTKILKDLRMLIRQANLIKRSYQDSQIVITLSYRNLVSSIDESAEIKG